MASRLHAEIHRRTPQAPEQASQDDSQPLPAMPAFETVWADDLHLPYQRDHFQLVRRQFAQAAAQKRERPWYRPWGNVMNNVCDQYVFATSTTGRFIFDNSGQEELEWNITCTSRDWRQELGDADFEPDEDDDPRQRGHGDQGQDDQQDSDEDDSQSYDKEDQDDEQDVAQSDDEDEVQIYDHEGSITPTREPSSGATAETVESEPQEDVQLEPGFSMDLSLVLDHVELRDSLTPLQLRRSNRKISPAKTFSLAPLSQTSERSKSDEPVVKRLFRVADGMILVRRAASDDEHCDVSTNEKIMPGLVYEIKVPFPAILGSNLDELEAGRAIKSAWEQIVQQVQFVFHTYSTVSVVWAAGICGRYSQFFRFLKPSVPEVDHKTISKAQPYFDSKRYGQVKARITSVFLAVGDDGKRSEMFKRYMHLALATAARQFDDKKRVWGATVTRRNNALELAILPPYERQLKKVGGATPASRKR